MTRREALVLRAFVVWTFYVWITRLWNIWRDANHGAAFKLVHTVLAIVSVAFAYAAWQIVRRNRKEARHGPEHEHQREHS
ncbi:MAG TPA: hypothetical protein VFA94_15845 [Acidimicrobiales bacterium]|nr:hypothetical protein [Acidimicrobiales bacterium]